MKKLLPLLAVATGACMSHVAASQMSARVLEQRTDSAAVPVKGAHLVLHCPDGLNEDLGTTNADGKLTIAPSTAPALDCKLTVAQAGYQEQSTSVGDVCTVRAANTCSALNLNVLLQRSGSAGY